MTMVGGLDVHRQQITFDYVDDDGLVRWGQIRPAAGGPRPCGSATDDGTCVPQANRAHAHHLTSAARPVGAATPGRRRPPPPPHTANTRTPAGARTADRDDLPRWRG